MAKELASVYGQWIELVAGYQKAVVHRALVEFSIILGIALVALFFTSWMDSLVRKVPWTAARWSLCARSRA